MSHYLKIADLNYLEYSEEIEIIGGYVSTFSYTSAGYGSAFGYSNASAYGQSTSTFTNTRTVVKDYNSATSSYAKAVATAYANNNGIDAKSSYRSTSIYYAGY